MASLRSVEVLFSNELVIDARIFIVNIDPHSKWTANMEAVKDDVIRPQQTRSWGVECDNPYGQMAHLSLVCGSLGVMMIGMKLPENGVATCTAVPDSIGLQGYVQPVAGQPPDRAKFVVQLLRKL